MVDGKLQPISAYRETSVTLQHCGVGIRLCFRTGKTPTPTSHSEGSKAE